MYRHIRILVAEDNPHDAYFLKRAFLKAGINAPLHFVHNGQEALDYLAGSHEFTDRGAFPLPSLMLLDIKMPLIDGFQVLKWLRQQPGLLKLPVIVFTSSGEPRDVDLAHELGANGYTVKPSGSEQLFETVQSLEHYWLKQHCYPTLSARPAEA